MKQSDSEAYKWFLNAAHKDNADAQCELAKMYEEGRGVEQSYTDAFYWYHHAEQNGSSEAFNRKQRLIQICNGDIEALASDLVADLSPEERPEGLFGPGDDLQTVVGQSSKGSSGKRGGPPSDQLVENAVVDPDNDSEPQPVEWPEEEVDFPPMEPEPLDDIMDLLEDDDKPSQIGAGDNSSFDIAQAVADVVEEMVDAALSSDNGSDKPSNDDSSVTLDDSVIENSSLLSQIKMMIENSDDPEQIRALKNLLKVALTAYTEDSGNQDVPDDEPVSGTASSDDEGLSIQDRLDAVTEMLKSIKDDTLKAAGSDSESADSSSKEASKSSNNCRYDISDSKFQPVDCPDVHFDDIAGLQDLKREIYETVILPVKRPDLFELMGLDASAGILMYGPPGTGKTMMGQAIATEIDAKFFLANGSDIDSRFPGESEENIAELFHSARAFDRSVIFFDEFESLGMSRDIGFNQDIYSGRITQLLKEIQGFNKNDSTIILLAATNRPWDIDSALLRPGRFGTHIYVGLPDYDAREYIVLRQFEGVPIGPDANLDEIVARTEWFNAAAVKNLCDRIKRTAISRCIDSDSVQIQDSDIQQELEKAKSSVSIDDLERFEAFGNQGS